MFLSHVEAWNAREVKSRAVTSAPDALGTLQLSSSHEQVAG